MVQGRQEMRLRILIGARAPRMVLPSTAITVLPSMVPVRVQNQHIKWASTSAGSWSCSTRRIVDSDGRTWPISTPRVSRSAVVCSQTREHLYHGQGQDREQVGAPLCCWVFLDSACFVFQTALDKPRNSRSTSCSRTSGFVESALRSPAGGPILR